MDPYDPEDPYYVDQPEPEWTLGDLYADCLEPTLRDGIPAAALLVPACVLFRIVANSRKVPRDVVHVASALAGLCCLYPFAGGLAVHVACFASFGAAVLFAVDSAVGRRRGLVCSLCCVAFLLACELFFGDPVLWQKVRGSQMIVAMKLISVALDVDRGSYRLPPLSKMLGYSLHVGTCVFGPWTSFPEYRLGVENGPIDLDALWVLSVMRSFLLAYMSLTVSTCWATWFIPVGDHEWPAAYRDALSFRFSHYFVSFLSETTAVASGISSSGSWDLSVASPKDIEVPRSLVSVVTRWNRPMHVWLKNYVFRPTKPYGTFVAIVLTYAASSLLHGINFQLAAVLLSLGCYTYTEYVLRRKLALVFDACVAAKRCEPYCEHRHKSDHPVVFAVNLFFGMLAVFHLAYLGVTFDGAPELQEQGYSMRHTLNKWARLQFASHWVAAFTFLFYLVI